jgi:hypothetical protein
MGDFVPWMRFVIFFAGVGVGAVVACLFYLLSDSEEP